MKKYKRLIILILSLATVGYLIFWLDRVTYKPTILATTPSNGSQNISLVSVLDLNFGKRVPQEVKDKIFVSFNPGVTFQSVWVADNVLRISPTIELEASTNYTVVVSFENKEIYNFSFRTEETYVYSEEEIETINNYAYATTEAFADYFKRFPFQEKMPLEGDNYRVVYDFTEEKFRIRLKMPENVPQELKDSALQEALTALEGVQIAPDAYGGYYVLYGN